jgi:hypothetical protein
MKAAQMVRLRTHAITLELIPEIICDGAASMR